MKSTDAAPTPISDGPDAVPTPPMPWHAAQLASYRAAPAAICTDWLGSAAAACSGLLATRGPTVVAQASPTSTTTAAIPPISRMRRPVTVWLSVCRDLDGGRLSQHRDVARRTSLRGTDDT